jgi:hypothetical protein
MKSQRRFAPKGVRNESESVAGMVGISNLSQTEEAVLYLL